jgi:cytochrome c-type biogenesis protein CcmE
MTTGTRLFVGGTVIAAVTSYMAYVGAESSWQYYLTVDECTADANELVGCPLRVNGHIASESLEIEPGRTRAAFVLRGARSGIRVACAGPLPDNLAEDMDVVVEGQLDTEGVLRGDRVLTRCASKYRSKPLGTVGAAATAPGPEVVR